jgi:hypothetical protein
LNRAMNRVASVWTLFPFLCTMVGRAAWLGDCFAYCIISLDSRSLLLLQSLPSIVNR